VTSRNAPHEKEGSSPMISGEDGLMLKRSAGRACLRR
jgi:hypothetical protein